MNEDSLILAIDTTTDQSGVALYDGSCLDEISWTSCRDQTVNLLAEIEHQLKRWNREISNVTVVAVATGPGRFNALRVGMSVAKGFVLAQSIPIIGIRSLNAVAWPYLIGEIEVVAVVSAGRGRVAWQRIRLQDGLPLAFTDTVNSDFGELKTTLLHVDWPIVVTGELTDDQANELRLLTDVLVPPVAGRLGRAGSLAELAHHRLVAGKFDDPVTLEPVYLHGKRRVSSTV